MQIFKSKQTIAFIAFFMVVILSIVAYSRVEKTKSIDATTYKEFLDRGLFVKAKLNDKEIFLYTLDAKYSIIRDGVNIEKLLEKVPVTLIEEQDYSDEIFAFILLAMVLFVAILYGKRESALKEKQEEASKHLQEVLSKEEQPFYKKVDVYKSDVTFKDVAGIDSVKEELSEIVDFLKQPEKYQAFGIKLPRGVLLIGPPGVGKTLIAKAVAGEADVPFFYQSGSSFVQIYVGMGAKRVRELFAQAKRNSPSIVFIDEVDAVGKARGEGRNDERESTLNQLLTEMDGFEDSSNVIVLAATNKMEVLDEALLRSGRFDRRVFVSLPNLEERSEILKVHLKDKPHDLNIEEISKMSVGFSGASLATLVNEAAIAALKRGASRVDKEDFESIKDKVLLGKKKILSYSQEEKEIQATYQAARALSAYWYEIDFDRVSLINASLRDIDREIESRTQMLSKLKVYLSGMVASQMFYSETFSNALEDITKAKILAQNMVEKYGMGEGIIPSQLDSASLIDEAVEDVETFLFKMKNSITEVAKILLDQESISKEELKKVIGEFL